jgi:uncharacterized Zn finger protein
VASVTVEKSIDPRTCGHEEIEQLGHEGAAVFLRCTMCGSIVIGHGAHRWIIRPTDEAGPLPY